MRKTILLFVVLHSISVTNAQASNDYRPFIEEGKVWVVGKFYGSSANGVPPHTTYTYFFDGDTIIDNKEYKKWRCLSEGKYGGENKLVSYLFEEDRKVWYIMPQTKEPKLLYDFGVSKGDTTWVSSPEIGRSECVITEIMQTTRNSHELNCYCFADDIDINYLDDSYQSCNFWMEGIGSAYSPVLNAKLNVPGYNDILLECRIEEQILYSRKDNPMGFLNDQNAFQISRYRPFIEDGKVWLVGDFPRGRQMPDAILTYYFDGDTIVGGHLCKRWMLDVKTSDRLYIHHNIWGSHTSLLAPVFEENRKVWFFRKGEDEPRLLYDFTEEVSEDGINVGSCEYGFDTKCYVDFVGTDDYRNGIRYVSVHDDLMLEEMTPDVREWFDTHKGDCGDYWTTMGYRWYEGIGTLLAPDLNVPHYRGEYRKVLCVTVGEDIIYENADANDVFTAIHDIPASQIVYRKMSNGKYYDLSGRRVSHLQKGVYIKDGRKVVVK